MSPDSRESVPERDAAEPAGFPLEAEREAVAEFRSEPERYWFTWTTVEPLVPELSAEMFTAVRDWVEVW
jgi:hypothetical protein